MSNQRLVLLLLWLLVASPVWADEWVGERATSRADSLLREARALLGTCYRYGATGNGAFDCSGLTAHLFGRHGYTLARSARAQARQGVFVGRDSLQPGDLVVFTGRRINKNRAGHIGIVVAVEEGDFRFIHACHRGVVESSFSQERYYRDRYIEARRILSVEDYRFPTLRPPMPAVELFNEPLSPPLLLPADDLKKILPPCATHRKKRSR